MTSFNTRGKTTEDSWWEIQHRSPTSDLPHYRDNWSTTDLGQFGPAAIILLRNRGPRGGRFTDRQSAIDYLARFVSVAELHTTTSFRVAAIRARIEVESVVEMTPPPICGKYGYYGRTGSRNVDLYCQQVPGHKGKHGPRETVAEKEGVLA